MMILSDVLLQNIKIIKYDLSCMIKRQSYNENGAAFSLLTDE